MFAAGSSVKFSVAIFCISSIANSMLGRPNGIFPHCGVRFVQHFEDSVGVQTSCPFWLAICKSVRWLLRCGSCAPWLATSAAIISRPTTTDTVLLFLARLRPTPCYYFSPDYGRHRAIISRSSMTDTAILFLARLWPTPAATDGPPYRRLISVCMRRLLNYHRRTLVLELWP